MYHINALERIIAALGKTMNVPKNFGVFHIVSLIIIILSCAAIVIFRHKIPKRLIPSLILSVGIVMIFFEIYKQLVISYAPTTDSWRYKWYIFPFQFCSTPEYITVFAFICHKLNFKKLYGASVSFLATYGLIAGTVVLIIPSTVFCPIIGINLQTVIHHGLMVILAITLLACGTVKPTVSSMKGAVTVFAPLLVLALVMNAIYGNGREFDMFYLSPESQHVLPILRDIFGHGFPPYPIYLVGYILLFTSGAALILYITRILTKYSTVEDNSNK